MDDCGNSVYGYPNANHGLSFYDALRKIKNGGTMYREYIHAQHIELRQFTMHEGFLIEFCDKATWHTAPIHKLDLEATDWRISEKPIFKE